MQMSRRLPPILIAIGILVVVVAIALFDRRGGAEARSPLRGDVDEVIAGSASEELPAQAEALLATDRPWRAARVMRAYAERVGEMEAAHRVLAARAEAGSGGWAEARALLEGLPALDTHADGVGLYLLGRARDEAGEPAAAAEAYRAFLALSAPAGEMEEERAAAQLRLALALTRAGDDSAAAAELRTASERAAGAARWVDLLRADALAGRGDTAAVRRAVEGETEGVEGLRAWRARVEAARRAGDLAGARALANQARAWAETSTTRAEFLVTAGRLALEMGDVAAGRDAMRAAIDLSDSGIYARQAADVLRQGEISPDDALAIARVDVAQGLQAEAVDGFRRWLEAGRGSSAERARVHMEHANALFYAERYDEVPAALRPIDSTVAAQRLLARAASHAGDEDEAVRIHLGLAERFRAGGTGRYSLFLAAGIRHEENDFRRARELYRQVVERYPGSDQTGLAMMRLAGMAFVEEEYAEAARIWDAYRNRYPRGSRALQATYWAGRAREEMGDTSAAAELYRAVRSRQRDSYYALLASERLGVPFWPLPMDASPAASPSADQRVAGWMQGIDLLRAADFHDEASAEADRVAAAAGNDRPTLYALAEALAERGYTQNAIRIGLQLRGSGDPDRRLLRILYPFPYRTLITEEARDRGLDPFVASALIRQESMYEARITSPAGARGLMQIMPATGTRLAEESGMDDWDAEMLYLPEINVHLGTRLLAEHMEDYDGSLPSVFSAYNAGPHRVEWWSEFEEYGNDEIFTERIPYKETRDYVKILTRNRAIYSGLYGGEAD